MKLRFELLREVRQATSHVELALLDQRLGKSFSHESYEETAMRLRDEDEIEIAAVYLAMETRWFQLDDCFG